MWPWILKRIRQVLWTYFANSESPSEMHLDFPVGAVGKEFACQCRRHKRWGFNPWVRKTLWRRKWQPSPVFLPGNSMDRRAWWGTVHGVTKSRTWLSTHTHARTPSIALSPQEYKKASVHDHSLHRWNMCMTWYFSSGMIFLIHSRFFAFLTCTS